MNLISRRQLNENFMRINSSLYGSCFSATMIQEFLTYIFMQIHEQYRQIRIRIHSHAHVYISLIKSLTVYNFPIECPHLYMKYCCWYDNQKIPPGKYDKGKHTHQKFETISTPEAALSFSLCYFLLPSFVSFSVCDVHAI